MDVKVSRRTSVKRVAGKRVVSVVVRVACPCCYYVKEERCSPLGPTTGRLLALKAEMRRHLAASHADERAVA